MDRGPRTGVTGAASQSDLDIGQGVGSRLGWALCRGPWDFDGLAKAMQFNFIPQVQV